MENNSENNVNPKMGSFQRKLLEEFRTRKVFSFFPFIIVSGFKFKSDFIWTGKWFKFVEIKEQKTLERFSEFDGGWSYMHYWTDWKEKWKFISLI